MHYVHRSYRKFSEVLKINLRLTIRYKGSWDTSELFYSQLQCVTEKIYKLRLTKGKVLQTNSGRNQIVPPGVCLLVVQSHGNTLILASIMCDNTGNMLPVRESHRSIDLQGFYWRSVTQACVACRTGLYHPSEQTRAFAKTHIASSNVCGQSTAQDIRHTRTVIHFKQSGPRPQARNNILIKYYISRDQSYLPRASLRSVLKRNTSMECSEFEQPKPAELTLFCPEI